MIGAALAALGAGTAQADPGAADSASADGGQQQEAAAVPQALTQGPKIMVAGVPLTPAAAFGMLMR